MDRDSIPSEQSTASAPSALSPTLLDKFNKFAPIILVVITLFTAITVLVSPQTDLRADIVEVKSEIADLRSEVRSEITSVRSEITAVRSEIELFKQNMMDRFGALEEIISTQVEYLDKKTNDNAQAIDTLQQTVNESFQ